MNVEQASKFTVQNSIWFFVIDERKCGDHRFIFYFVRIYGIHPQYFEMSICEFSFDFSSLFFHSKLRNEKRDVITIIIFHFKFQATNKKKIIKIWECWQGSNVPKNYDIYRHISKWSQGWFHFCLLNGIFFVCVESNKSIPGDVNSINCLYWWNMSYL